MRLFKPNVSKMEAKREVAPLIEVLVDKNESLRLAAVEALGRIGDAQAIEPLSRALSDCETIAIAAVRSLREIGDARAVWWLSSALNSKFHRPTDDRYGMKIHSPAVRKAAANSLGQFSAPRAVVALCIASEDKDEDVRVAVFKALATIGDMGPSAKRALSRGLSDERCSVRKAAVEAIDKTGMSIDTCIQAPYAVVKGDWTSAIALGSESIGILSVTVRDSSAGRRERQAAAKALGQLGDAKAADALASAMQSLDPEVRDAAIVSLSQIADMLITGTGDTCGSGHSFTLCPWPDSLGTPSKSVRQYRTAAEEYGDYYEVSGQWGGEIWLPQSKVRLQRRFNPNEFFSQDTLPIHVVSDDGFKEKIKDKEDPQAYLRMCWAVAYLHHPNPNVLIAVLQAPIPNNKIGVLHDIAYLMTHGNVLVEEAAIRFFWKSGPPFDFIMNILASRGLVPSRIDPKRAKWAVQRTHAVCPSDCPDSILAEFESIACKFFGPSILNYAE